MSLPLPLPSRNESQNILFPSEALKKKKNKTAIRPWYGIRLPGKNINLQPEDFNSLLLLPISDCVSWVLLQETLLHLIQLLASSESYRELFCSTKIRVRHRILKRERGKKTKSSRKVFKTPLCICLFEEPVLCTWNLL